MPIYGGRDLARDDLWAVSVAVAAKKREIARQAPQLPKARRANVSLVVAAIAAAAPALSFAHSKPKAKDSRQGRVIVRGLWGAEQFGREPRLRPPSQRRDLTRPRDGATNRLGLPERDDDRGQREPWTAGSGWHAIQSSVTYRDHVDHVHVDTF